MRIGKYLEHDLRVAAREAHQLVIQDPVFILEN
ncbi:MAG: hypothetical protein K0S36_2663, partial [Nitrosospira multiformis]|nr:hypothetical protein [Nitrosospira multiformis]